MRGTVTDNVFKESLIGVTIVIEATFDGTVTDIDGELNPTRQYMPRATPAEVMAQIKDDLQSDLRRMSLTKDGDIFFCIIAIFG